MFKRTPSHPRQYVCISARVTTVGRSRFKMMFDGNRGEEPENHVMLGGKVARSCRGFVKKVDFEICELSGAFTVVTFRI